MTLVQIPFESFCCLAIIALGIPVYGIGVVWKKPKKIQEKFGKIYSKNLNKII